MGVSGTILKNRLDYSIEKLLSDITIAVNSAGINMISSGETVYNQDGSFRYKTLNISSASFDIEEPDQFLFYVSSIDEKLIDEESDKEFDFIENGKKLYKVAWIEEVSGNENVVFKFVYEYLKLNPNDYFWFEDEFAFNYQDMSNLSKLPFDSEWCYKNPKLI